MKEELVEGFNSKAQGIQRVEWSGGLVRVVVDVTMGFRRMTEKKGRGPLRRGGELQGSAGTPRLKAHDRKPQEGRKEGALQSQSTATCLLPAHHMHRSHGCVIIDGT